jgi:hypothetical protein
MGISTSYGVVFFITALADCRPFSYNFYKWEAEVNGTCINISHSIYASAIINIILDGIITLMPMTQM